MTDWEKCVEFHGHACGGLTIGYQAARYAKSLLGLTRSPDEQVVCIAENDACGVDAIQVMLGCSVGKGNLILRVMGKQAFSFYERASGRSVRLVLRRAPEGMTKEESFRYYQEHEPEELFDVKPAVLPVPERARIYRTLTCEGCGESVGEAWVRLRDGKCLCLVCAGSGSES